MGEGVEDRCLYEVEARVLCALSMNDGEEWVVIYL
jgi:hypothetical protein